MHPLSQSIYCERKTGEGKAQFGGWPSLLAEVSNAVWKHHSVYGKISLEDALLMFNALKEAQEIIVFEPIGKYISPAQKISVEEEVSIYDALYIVQAQKYGRLLTSDKKQSEIAQNLEIEVEFIE